MEFADIPDEIQHRFELSTNVVRQTLPEELLLSLFGSSASRVRAPALPEQNSNTPTFERMN
jgi:hypothetical protein